MNRVASIVFGALILASVGCSAPRAHEAREAKQTAPRVTEKVRHPGSAPETDAYTEWEAKADKAEQAMKVAKTNAQRAKAFKHLKKVLAAEPKIAWGKDPIREAISPDEARAWWPHSILRARSLPRADERFYAVTQAGGRRGDPTKEQAALYVVYEFAPATTDTNTYNEVLDGGGIFVVGVFSPPAQAGVERPDPKAKIVTVRGTKGFLYERTPPTYNVNWIDLTWRTTAQDGVVTWKVTGGANVYQPDEILAFANAMSDTA